MCILGLKEQSILARAEANPSEVDDQLRDARARIQREDRYGRVTVCYGGANRLLNLTESLWDYYCDREGIR